MIRRSLLVFLILAAAASACAPNTVILTPTNYYITYTPSVVNSAAGSGGMLVEIVGNPFDVDQADLEQVVTSAMKGSHFGPPVDFVTVKPDGFTSPYRIVMVFDDTRNYTETKLCKDGTSIEPGTGGEYVMVHAALCAAKQPLTGVSGRVGGVTDYVTSPDDWKFHQLIKQITINLLPPSNPDRRRDNPSIIL